MENIIGKQFGRITVVRMFKKGHALMCEGRCVCGNTTNSQSCNLKSGYTKSCGCLQIESVTRHGRANTTEYQIWESMKQRCNKPNRKSYKYYGAMGVRVCKRWDKFENFFSDMGKRPKGKTLDRFPNNCGDYKPSNCRWATWKQQAANRRK